MNAVTSFSRMGVHAQRVIDEVHCWTHVQRTNKLYHRMRDQQCGICGIVCSERSEVYICVADVRLVACGYEHARQLAATTNGDEEHKQPDLSDGSTSASDEDDPDVNASVVAHDDRNGGVMWVRICENIQQKIGSSGVATLVTM